MSMGIAKRLAAALLLGTLAGTPALAQQAANPQPLDLVQDAPSITESVTGFFYGTAAWTWGLFTTGVAKVAPPSPTSLASSVDDKDQSELFKLLSIAGYKLKEIDSQVGIIPTIAFDFAMVRQLSEADIDYLEAELEQSRFQHPGLYTEIQRTIVGTVLAINSGKSYQVSEMTVQVLPLPEVEFSVTPVIAALGEESSILMRAIQRIERGLRGINKPQQPGLPNSTPTNTSLVTPVAVKSPVVATSVRAVEPAPAPQRYLNLDLSGWIFGGAMILIVLGLLVELVRRLLDSTATSLLAITNACFMLGGGMWLALGYIIGSWLVMTGGALVFGFALALLLQRVLMPSRKSGEPPAPTDNAVPAAS